MTTLTLSDQATDIVRAGVTLQQHLFEANRQTYRQRLQALERRYHMTTK